MSIDITIEEMEALPAESYELFDIRGEIERAHGILPNSTASSADVLMENPPEDKEKKIIICCSRGQISRDIAEELQDQGYEAYSLKGGYVGWLMADMKKKEADDVCEHVELSIRKKFKKKIWSKFTKAVREYELVKEGDRIAVCISGGKDSMLMAKLFQELKRHNKFNFEVKFLVMDPGYSSENRKVIEENARKMKIPIQIFESNIFDAVYENKPFILNAYRCISRDQIESFLFHLTSDLLMSVVEEKAEGTSISEEDRRFIADFYKYSFVGLMLDWIKQGMKDDYIDLARKISITIRGSLTHSIENFSSLSEKENS